MVPANPFSKTNIPPPSFGHSLPLIPPIDAEMNVEKLKKIVGAVRTGGKGSVRRKKKAVHRTNTTDDKRLQTTLKGIGVNSIPSIEEVNIFKDDIVIHFLNLKFKLLLLPILGSLAECLKDEKKTFLKKIKKKQNLFKT
ncbi:putative nascent polypeptide-associated complex NAC domain, NAC A/B domain superfamily [Helianthus anomalus]